MRIAHMETRAPNIDFYCGKYSAVECVCGQFAVDTVKLKHEMCLCVLQNSTYGMH